jgi:hypothetical protein
VNWSRRFGGGNKSLRSFVEFLLSGIMLTREVGKMHGSRDSRVSISSFHFILSH